MGTIGCSRFGTRRRKSEGGRGGCRGGEVRDVTLTFSALSLPPSSRAQGPAHTHGRGVRAPRASTPSCVVLGHPPLTLDHRCPESSHPLGCHPCPLAAPPTPRLSETLWTHYPTTTHLVQYLPLLSRTSSWPTTLATFTHPPPLPPPYLDHRRTLTALPPLYIYAGAFSPTFTL